MYLKHWQCLNAYVYVTYAQIFDRENIDGQHLY